MMIKTSRRKSNREKNMIAGFYARDKKRKNKYENDKTIVDL